MPFYDKVKRQIRGDDRDTASEDEEEQEMGFDELKQAAEAGGGNAERRGDSTEIEVLQDGELQSADDGTADGFPERDAQEERSVREARDTAQRAVQGADASPAAAADDVTALLEQVTEQNQEIIGLLRGIKRGLER